MAYRLALILILLGKEGERDVKFKPTQEKMDMLFTQKLKGKRWTEMCGHLVVGGLNPTAWKEGYQLWMADHGAWELSDPGLATHRKGGALDKMIFQPWGHVPDCFLEGGREEVDFEELEWGSDA